MNLENKKIWIGEDRELCIKVQEKAFELGWGWGGSGDKKAENLHASSLFFWDTRSIYYSNYGRQAFDHESFVEITPEEMGIYTMTQDEPKPRANKNHEIVSNELKDLLAQIKSM